MFRKLLVSGDEHYRYRSMGIVILLATFMGAVMCLQTAHQVSGWIPVYTIGFTVRQTMILNSAPSNSHYFSGKVGSNIASQLGTNEVTGDRHMQIMGVNSAGYLVL